jgi:translation initiation factor 3 subunit L
MACALSFPSLLPAALTRAQNLVKVVEATVGRRYAGWFLKNAEHAARVYTQVRNGALPVRPAGGAPPQKAQAQAPPKGDGAPKEGKKVAWGAR